MGQYLSIADTTGTIRLLTLPKHMHETTSTEESDTRDFTIRETERLKFITGRSVESEEDAKSEKKSEKGEKEEEEEKGVEEEKEEELSPSVLLYNRYKKMEEEILIKVGMMKKPEVVERKKSIIPTGNKALNLLKP